ncbi:hypothetical protein Sjap_016736 [Stephania japonica]|uniref:HTH La-type RNA-binding domain-containing protein n=1 Tax=Stephania japonica TaxID=461633 RepID=A0AAP0I4W9_9MAGN
MAMAMAAATDSGLSPPPPWGAPPQSQYCSEDSTNISAGISAVKNPVAWNKPANSTVQEVGPVMGAISWPALSDSTRPLPRSSSSSFSLLDNNNNKAKSLSAQDPNQQPTPPPPPPPPPPTSSASPNSIPNNALPLRHKSTKRGGEGSRPPPQIAFTVEVSVPSRNDSANSGPSASPSHSRKTGRRREHDRTNHDWSVHRNSNGRDAHLHLQQPFKPFPLPRTRSFARHPPPTNTIPPFILHPHPPPPPPPRHFGNTIGFHGVTTPLYYALPLSHKSIRGVPSIHAPPPTPPPIFFPAPHPQLLVSLLFQIDYYFSHDNLCKDIFLRQRMDNQGWVPVSFIATFNRVRQLTNNTRIILDAVRASTVVEVKGDKIRRRSDWKNWLLPPSTNRSTTSAAQPPHILHNDTLVTQLQNVRLEERDLSQNTVLSENPPLWDVTSKPASVELNCYSQTFIMDGIVPSVVQECSD